MADDKWPASERVDTLFGILREVSPSERDKTEIRAVGSEAMEARLGGAAPEEKDVEEGDEQRGRRGPRGRVPRHPSHVLTQSS